MRNDSNESPQDACFDGEIIRNIRYTANLDIISVCEFLNLVALDLKNL